MADGAFCWRSRTRSVVVVDEVELSRVVTAIGCAMYPVIDYIIDEVEDAVPTDRRIASTVRSPQVSDECCILAAQCRTESMIVGVERLRRNGVLNGHIHSRILIGRGLVLSLRFIIHMTIERNVLVQSPLTRAVVDHDVSYGITTEGILAMFHPRFTTTETHMTNDDVVCIDGKRLASNADAIARGCLSGYGDIWSTNIDGSFQSNDTGDIEYHNSRATCLTSLTERTRSAVVEVRYDINLAASASESVHTTAFSTGKSRDIGLRQVVRTMCPLDIGTTFACLLLDDGERLLPCDIRHGILILGLGCPSGIGFARHLRILSSQTQRTD